MGQREPMADAQMNAYCMYDTPVVCFLVALFAGIIMVMLSRLSQTSVVTVYKYLPRDLDTWLRESPNATVSQNRLFASDDWTTVKAVHAGRATTSAPQAGGSTMRAPVQAPVQAAMRPPMRPPATTGGLFSGMSHTRIPGT